ncbi:hypothetical protein LIX60_24365 [Streptomyces sp. S07_1.15]|uniref:hypothetical protein n=1 Tax=Streptomyces sp. S07_1.15 TaxID=2873925 RepID=UPI001D159233|nr:hypothetical protein [Streptomyces sp. S07_1.15]MCC3654539.1 hypothetical protein [Streptomyces sp. S07_1.15]
MAFPGRYGRVRAAAPAVAALLVLFTLLPACGRADPGDRSVQRLLDRRSAALLDRDERAFLAETHPSAGRLRARQREVLRNLAEVPLASWEYDLTGTGGFEPAPGEGRRIAVRVRLSYRLSGHDTGPATADQRLTLAERGGRWYIAAEHPTGDGPEPLWEQGRVEAVRGSRSLVLGVGHDRGRLRGIARTADRAVPAVDAAWGGGWARRVVVLVPRSPADMAELLGDPPGSYRGIAAVTTGRTGGAPGGPADRVIVNPAAYGILGETGQDVVLTHETAHVATRAHTSPATPLWLSEGFADWAGYRDTDRPASRIAPELAREVTAGRAPGALPGDEDFSFTGDARRLARAYEAGWLACRMIAEEWGEETLVSFYRAVGEAGPDRSRALEAALREQLGLGPAAFTARWRAYAESRLG